MSGLDGVVEDGTIVLGSFRPLELHPRVTNVLHPDHSWRPGDPWRTGHANKTDVFSLFHFTITRANNTTTGTRGGA